MVSSSMSKVEIAMVMVLPTVLFMMMYDSKYDFTDRSQRKHRVLHVSRSTLYGYDVTDEFSFHFRPSYAHSCLSLSLSRAHRVPRERCDKEEEKKR